MGQVKVEYYWIPERPRIPKEAWERRNSDYRLYANPATEPGKARGEIAATEARIWVGRSGWVHRSQGPAVEYADGDKLWVLYGYPVNDERTRT